MIPKSKSNIGTPKKNLRLCIW